MCPTTGCDKDGFWRITPAASSCSSISARTPSRAAPPRCSTAMASPASRRQGGDGAMGRASPHQGPRPPGLPPRATSRRDQNSGSGAPRAARASVRSTAATSIGPGSRSARADVGGQAHGPAGSGAGTASGPAVPSDIETGTAPADAFAIHDPSDRVGMRTQPTSLIGTARGSATSPGGQRKYRSPTVRHRPSIPGLPCPRALGSLRRVATR